MNTVDAKRVLETALICSHQPIQVRELRVLFQDDLGADTIKTLLEELQLDWAQRGVTINSLVLKQLEDRGWVEVIGHRETVGRPGLYATTRQFLDDLGLASLDHLPVYDTAQAQANAFARLGEDDPAPQLALDGVDLVTDDAVAEPLPHADVAVEDHVPEARPAFDLVSDTAPEQKTENAPSGDEPHES